MATSLGHQVPPDPSPSLQLELPPCVIPGGLTFCDLDSSLTLSGGVSSHKNGMHAICPSPFRVLTNFGKYQGP